MNSKNLKTRTAPIAALLTTVLLSIGGLASANSVSTLTHHTYDVTMNTNAGTVLGNLNTDASWQTIEVPLAEIGGTVPTDLSLWTAGLPEGLRLSLERVSQVGNTLVLNVDVTGAATGGIAEITLVSGTTPLTTFQVPILTLAARED